MMRCSQEQHKIPILISQQQQKKYIQGYGMAWSTQVPLLGKFGKDNTRKKTLKHLRNQGGEVQNSNR